jgi:hypothetical protein
MTDEDDDDVSLSDLAAIAPDAKLMGKVVELLKQRADEEEPESDDESGDG